MVGMLKKLMTDGFSAKDIERLRLNLDKAAEKLALAEEVDGFLQRAAVTLLPPQRAALWFQVAEAYREGGDAPSAMTTLRRALDEDSTHTDAAKELIALAEANNANAELVKALQVRAQQLRRSESDAQRVELHRRAAGLLARELDDVRSAFFESLRALRALPMDDDVFEETLDYANRSDSASDLAAIEEDLYARAPDDSVKRLHLQRLAVIYERSLMDVTKSADTRARMAVLHAPSPIPAASAEEVARAIIDLDELRRTEARLRRERRYSELVQAYAQHEIGLPPDAVEERSDVALMAAMVVGEELGEAERALQLCDRALQHDPRSDGAHRFFVDLCLREQWFARAAKACERWGSERQSLEAWLKAGDLFLSQLNDLPRAEHALASARAIDSSHAGVVALAYGLQATRASPAQ